MNSQASGRPLLTRFYHTLTIYLQCTYNFDIEFFLLSSLLSQKHSYSQLHALGQPFYYHVSGKFNDIHDRHHHYYGVLLLEIASDGNK